MGGNNFNNTLIVICGPTAVGKTAVAIHIAKLLGAEIISADSRQCFKELNIGVARPLEEELKSVTHHFIASLSIHEEMNASFFEQWALLKISELCKQSKVVVLVGGTGLYIKALCEGLDLIPPIPKAIREKINNSYDEKGIAWLQDEISKKDLHYASNGEMNNPQRMMRALEVMEGTGKSIFSFRDTKKVKRDFNILKIGLTLPKQLLHENINHRVERMIESGLVTEVKSLLPFRSMNALQTVGYTEIFDYLNGSISLPQAIEKIKMNTRKYAKRQMTWFNKDKEINWFEPSAVSDIQEFINAKLRTLKSGLL